MLEKLFARLDANADLVVAWQREMTARPALGPDNNGVGEIEKAIWLEAEMLRLGFEELSRHDSPDERVPCGLRPNIAARVRGKSPRTLWVIAHMDVVPPGDESLWRHSPWELAVDGDLVTGRGVEDNQQAIVSGLLAAEALLALGVKPDLSLGLLFVSDEETGMAHGLPHVLASAPGLFAPDDMFLVPDMGSHDGEMVEVAEKSCLWLRFIVTGRQCHASMPEQGLNSLVAASACVLELERLYRVFRQKNPLFVPSWSTFVPSKKEANVENINTLPGRDVFYLDCRVLPEYDLNEVRREVRLIADEVAARYKVSIDIETVHEERAPKPTAADAEIVRRLVKALRARRGFEAQVCGVGGQTVAACLRHLNLDTAVWATLMPNPHTPNECSRISAAVDDAKIILDLLFDDASRLHGLD